MGIEPFRVSIDDSILDDLRERLARTRWPDPIEGDSWEFGTDLGYLKELCRYWQSEFDWRGREEVLNSLQHFRACVGGTPIHFIHEKAQGKGRGALLLVHGWPDSFVRFLKLIPLLTDWFDVIVPSLPGYGFSGKIPKAGASFEFGPLLHKLMRDELGYDRYGVHGGDWGSMVCEQMSHRYPSHVVGAHLTDVPFYHLFQKVKDVTPEEKKYLEQAKEFQQKGAAYALIQSTRPQTLAYGLNDSPAGLAAWIVEKFREWSDCGGDVGSKFSKDELLTNITIYWATATINTSFLPYFDRANAGALRWTMESMKELGGSAKTPTGFAMFPKDISKPPRSWAERFFQVTRWTEMARGGHFAAMEEPELLAGELLAFFG